MAGRHVRRGITARNGFRDPGEVGATLELDPDAEPTRRERTATLIERRLDPVMAVLAVFWGLYLGYELVAPASQRPTLTVISNAIWGLFLVEFAVRIAVSGAPVRYVRRHWPSLLFLALPVLRVLRIVPALRALRVLPAARVVGASYRAVGTARGLLQGRIAFLLAMTTVAILSGGQLLVVLERGRDGGVASLGEALWWSANLCISSTLVFEPVTLAGRVLAIGLSAYAIVVFASLAATLGAFFVESRREQAQEEEAAG